MALHIEAAGKWMSRRHVDIGQGIFNQPNILDRSRGSRADRRHPNAGLLCEETRKLLKLCWKIIVNEQHVHFDLNPPDIREATSRHVARPQRCANDNECLENRLIEI